jgi:hypothetical protein
MVRTIVLFLLLGALEVLAQPTVFVAYDGARLYADADYLSEIVDTLTIGDTLVKLESAKKFVRVRARDGEGWILAANISERPPKTAPRAKGEGRAAVSAGDTHRAADAANGTDEVEAADAVDAVDAADATNAVDAADASDAPQTPGSARRRASTRGTAPASKPEPSAARCAATTKSGSQCSRKAGAGSAYCWQHAK